MKISRLFLSLFLIVSTPAIACLNDYKPNQEAIARSKSLMEQLTRHSVKEDWRTREARLRKEFANGGDYRVKNDLATTLTHTNKASEAVELLEQIEAEKPGLYMTASNLGTAYELSGNNEKAIEWIRKGIERNPDSHEGTEWLHVRILEAKIALSKDPKWLESNSVFGALDAQSHRPKPKASSIDLESKKITQIEAANATGSRPKIEATGNRNEKLSSDKITTALIHQLHERLQFVKPPEAIVGSLLLDLGDMVATEETGFEGAVDVYKLSLRYLEGLSNVEALEFATQLRLDQGYRRSGHAGTSDQTWVNAAYVAGGLFLGIYGISAIRRRKRNVAYQS